MRQPPPRSFEPRANVLLLAGYDKLAHTSTEYQNDEIKVARQRLTAWKVSQAKAAKAAKRASGKPKRAKSRRAR